MSAHASTSPCSLGHTAIMGSQPTMRSVSTEDHGSASRRYEAFGPVERDWDIECHGVTFCRSDTETDDDRVYVLWNRQCSLCVVSWLFCRGRFVDGGDFCCQHGLAIGAHQRVEHFGIADQLTVT